MNNGIILYKGQTLEDNYFNKIISALAWAEPVTVMGKIGKRSPNQFAQIDLNLFSKSTLSKVLLEQMR